MITSIPLLLDGVTGKERLLLKIWPQLVVGDKRLSLREGKDAEMQNCGGKLPNHVRNDRIRPPSAISYVMCLDYGAPRYLTCPTLFAFNLLLGIALFLLLRSPI